MRPQDWPWTLVNDGHNDIRNQKQKNSSSNIIVPKI